MYISSVEYAMVSRPIVAPASVAGRRFGLIAAALLAGVGLAGCVIAPLPPQGGPMMVDQGQGPLVVAPMAPPAPIAEVMVAAPVPGYIWIGGYWSWVGGRHVWTGGRWTPPRPGYRWVPRQWSQGAGGWHQHGGHWAR